jgi:hypothetical protein
MTWHDMYHDTHCSCDVQALKEAQATLTAVEAEEQQCKDRLQDRKGRLPEMVQVASEVRAVVTMGCQPAIPIPYRQGNCAMDST